MTNDPKPMPRIRDPELMRILHADPHKQCALTGETWGIELHHVLPRSQRGDDVRDNLVALTYRQHALITRNDPEACAALGAHIEAERPDVIAYLYRKLGTGALAWMQRRLYIGVE